MSSNKSQKSAASDKGSPSSSGTPPNDGTNLNSDIANLTLADDEQVEVRTNGTGYSTTTETRKARGYYTPPFIRNSATPSSNPFPSPPTGNNRGASSSGNNHGASSSGLQFNAMAGKNWRNSDSSSGSVPTPSVRRKLFGTISQPASVNRPIDPQALFPVSAAVFVANLRQGDTDSSLEVAVTKAFRDFGHVWVKVKRDRKDMPMAFLQYRLDAHAKKAVEHGPGIIISNRPCRVEPGKANREYYIERRHGGVITLKETRRILRDFGNLLDSHVASLSERGYLDVGPGVIVKFEFYDNGVAAHSYLRNSEDYKMQAINTLTRNSTSGRNSYNVSSDERSFLEAHELDGRSIHVGNLPVGVTEAELRELFSRFGNILNVDIRQYPSKFEPYHTQVFAFIEFEDVRSPDPAIDGMHGRMFRDRSLRVTQRKTENRTTSVSRFNSGVSRTMPSDAPSRAQSGASDFQTPPTVAPVSSMMQTPPASAPGFSTASMMQTPASAPGFSTASMMQTPASAGPFTYVVPAMMQPPPAYGASPYAPSGYGTSHYAAGHTTGQTYSYSYYDPSTGFYSPPSVSPYQGQYFHGSGHFGHGIPSAGTSPQQAYAYGYGVPSNGAPSQQTYNYGYPGYPAYPSFTGQQVYPSQFPTGPMYSTPAAAQAAAHAHAHPQTDTMTTQDGSDVTETPVDEPNVSSEVDESG